MFASYISTADFPIELFNRTVDTISFDTENKIIMKMLNGQIIREEGDAVINKTYTVDCISKKKKRNNGERAEYYVENNHPARSKTGAAEFIAAPLFLTLQHYLILWIGILADF